MEVAGFVCVSGGCRLCLRMRSCGAGYIYSFSRSEARGEGGAQRRMRVCGIFIQANEAKSRKARGFVCLNEDPAHPHPGDSCLRMSHLSLSPRSAPGEGYVSFGWLRSLARVFRVASLRARVAYCAGLPSFLTDGGVASFRSRRSRCITGKSESCC